MTPLQRWLLHISLGLLVLSGVAFAIMKYLLVSDDPYSAVGHPMQPWALSLHVLAGPVAVFAVGWIFRDHIVARKRQRDGSTASWSGSHAALLLAPMIASGYLLQVVTNESVKKLLVIVHLATGSVYAVFYAAHVIRARRGTPLLVLLMLGAATTSEASSPCDGVERVREVMGSLARVVICEPDDESAAEASASAALDVFDRIDRLMSLYKPESELSRLNREGFPGPVVLDSELIDVLAASKALTQETGGRFDVTIKPLMDHFGFYRELGFAPPPGGLAGALGLVGSDGLVLDASAHSASFHRSGMGVDLGGIAKGYALDRAAEVLRQRGVRRAFLDLGRNLMFVGPGPLPGGRWRAGIADPVEGGAIAACVDVPEGALSTSSPSGRIVGGVGHILDPRRGKVEGRFLQATVWSPSATRADALSTAVLLLTPRASRNVLAVHREAAVVFRGNRRAAIGPIHLSRCDS